ncbi:hypothetical protein JR316_0002157 [Psilocybe cubensis]|uniref:Uncharacterized protein n=2 Tax=Psilocybe cubensis TaxID=181762 RepID=A0ACB8HBZ3_PSICU|nr:hypothetical protein JR316_0002157 [Psilocybe cubensis]KAH9485250.1 hypothetical protein JR316_0002157 [Psilocybe cubensis]
MTRGRKKDLTIPPTRTLVQQRDYRARKANYIAGLEERCRKAEEENVQLRRELAQMRARLANPAVILPETIEVSKELMQNLALATASLAKFQQLTFATAENHEPAGGQSVVNIASRMEETHNIRGSPQESLDGDIPPAYRSHGHGRKLLFMDDDRPPISAHSQNLSTTFSTPSPASSSECCGGILDCDALDCDGIIEDKDERGGGGPRTRVSGLRSTSISEFRLRS